MKKLLLSLLLFLLLPVTGWGATIYVKDDPNNSGTKVCYKADGFADATCSDGTGNTDINAAIAAAGIDGTVVLSGGASGYTYTGTQIDATDGLDTTSAGLTLRGATTADGAGHAGAVVVDATGLSDYPLTVYHNCTVENLTFTGADSGKANVDFENAPTVTFNDVILTGGANTIGSYVNDGAAITFNRCTFKDSAGNLVLTSSGSVGQGATWIFNYCKFFGLGTNTSTGFIASKSRSVTINNGIFARSNGYAIKTNNSGDVLTINNSLFFAGDFDQSAQEILYAASGSTFTLNNCMIQPSAWSPTAIAVGTVTYNNCKVDHNAYPRFRHARYPSIISVVIDDVASLEHAQVVATAAEAFGYKISVAVDPGNAVSADWVRANNLFSRGHGISCHSNRHASVGSRTAFNIQYVGVGSAATMTIADNTLTTSCTDDAASNLNIDLTNASYDYCNELCTHINGLAAYTCELGDEWKAGARAQDLADITAQDIRTDAYATQLDETKYFTNEMVTAKAAIEENIPGLTVTTFCPPGNQTDETAQTAMKDIGGFLGARGSSTWATGSKSLASLSIYNVVTRHITYFGTSGNTDSIARNTLAFAEFLSEYGGLATIFAHSTEFTASDWTAFFGALAKTNISVMSFEDAIAQVRSLGSTADSGVTYTRTLTDASDFRLKPDSPAINAGTDVGLTTDYAGRAIRGLPDIGAYEFYGVYGGMMLLNLGR